MTKTITRTYSFSKEYKDVVDYLDSIERGDKSSYIAKLVRKDMNGCSLEERVKAIVAQELQRQPNNTEIKNLLGGLVDDE